MRKPRLKEKQPTSSNSIVQVFGGPWSLIKTAMVDEYIRFFNAALKNMPFERVYIDAFAGSGAFRWVVGAPKNTLFGPYDETKDIHAGSARRRLQRPRHRGDPQARRARPRLALTKGSIHSVF
jgi:hypothetical protein